MDAQHALAARPTALRLHANRRPIAALLELDFLDASSHFGAQPHFRAIPADDMNVARNIHDLHVAVGGSFGAALHGFAGRTLRNEEREQAINYRLHSSILVADAGVMSVTSANT